MAVLFDSIVSYAQEVPPAPDGMKPSEEKYTELPPKLESIFFTPNEISVLARVKNIYGRQGLGEEEIYNEEDLLTQLQNLNLLKADDEENVGEDGALQDIPLIVENYYTQFYLESIIYHSPTDWKVRVREDYTSHEYRPDTMLARPSLKILSLSKEQVTFEWTPINWPRILQAHKRHSAAIHLEPANKSVIFSLMVNQTLFSYDMTVREGIMTPIAFVIETPAEQNLPEKLLQDLFSADSLRGALNTGPLLEEDEPVDEGNGSTIDGVSGLMDAYQQLQQ